MNNENNIECVLRSLVPKECRMVDGRLKGGFVDWDSKEGKAVNEALFIISKYEEVNEILEPLRNFNTHNEYIEELKKIVN